MDTSKWQWFKVGDIFEEPYKAIAYNAIDLQECSANNPNAILYITRTDTNNGCKSFVINNNFIEIEQANAITIGDTTSTIYYQKDKFICGDHIVVLRSKFLNYYTGMFIISLLNRERFRYSYGRAFKKDIIKQTNIKLPVAKEGKPDWNYIENFIKETIIPKLPKKSFDVWNNAFDTTPLINK